MNDKNFTHLHVHTGYSLLDGMSKIPELVSRVKELGMTAAAITDHGAMYGAIEFYKEAVKQGIKPIIGCEVYVASKSRFNKVSSPDNFYYHLVLLAENNEGYSNLIKLVSYGFTEGFYYKPRVDEELLRKYNKGIIALSACLAGPVARTMLREGYAKAKQKALLYSEIFGEGNFYLELQDHGIEEQQTVNQALMRIHNETGLPLVCTNDSHYINAEDAEAHDLLLCLQTQTTISDENRMRYAGNQFYLKSPDEMYALFPYAEEACRNTQVIADRCNVTFEFNKYKLPKFDVPDGKTSYQYLCELCTNGLEMRYGSDADKHRQRLEYELETIKQMGFVDYFLIVGDFISYAKQNGIAVGPGRGSAAGSVVAYCLQITDIDPIKFDLIFERFLNPERVSMPDIDIDFCYERRQEVIDYVKRKYGDDQVAQIITFGTMAARNAIRDVGRVLEMPYADVDKIAKAVPDDLHITIKDALEKSHELRSAYDSSPDVKKLIDMSMKLEGLPRHVSTHAAGVIISDRPIMDYVPLNYNPKDGAVSTQYVMTTCEELGLLKMDFLGLRTLTVIQDTVKDVKRIYGIDLDMHKIPYDDAEVYRLISSGRTLGVFQLESAGMRSFMKELQPENIEDIIAGISLYRPGPMDFIPKYIGGKRSAGNITYTHPALENILKSTYGCIVYQEQVMQIVRELAGYSLGRSDMVRRAMSKKKADVMAKERESFINGNDTVPGCVKNGIPADAANKIFDEMTDFAKYAFNKSHAAAYAVVAYQTAWLKKHYPVEFMASLMTSLMDRNDKVVEYIADCRSMGIKTLPPDINKSYGRFTVSNGNILYALSAIKSVGTGNIEALVNERNSGGEYKSLTQFIERLGSTVNSRCLESLILAGAFDSLGGKRAQYMSVYRAIYDGVGQRKKKTLSGQISLFDTDMTSNCLYSDNLPDIPEFSDRQKLSYEKELTGIYISGHPLDNYIEEIKKHITNTTLDFPKEDDLTEKGKLTDGTRVILGGVIASVTKKYTRKGQLMAFAVLEDLYSHIEVIFFPDAYSKYSDLVKEENIVIITGRASISDASESKLICEQIMTYDMLEERNKTLWLKIPSDSDVTPVDLKNIVSRHPGAVKVKIYVEKTKQRLALNDSLRVSINNELLDNLRSVVGEGSVVVK